MSLVYVKHYLVPAAFQLCQTLQLGRVSVHAEYAFGDYDYPVAAGVLFFYQRFQLAVVLMPVAYAAGSAQADAVDETGVYQFVSQDERVFAAQGWKDACVHVIAAAEHQCVFPSIKGGQSILKGIEHSEIAGQQAGGGRRQRQLFAGVPEPFTELLHQSGVGGQP